MQSYLVCSHCGQGLAAACCNSSFKLASCQQTWHACLDSSALDVTQWQASQHRRAVWLSHSPVLTAALCTHAGAAYMNDAVVSGWWAVDVPVNACVHSTPTRLYMTLAYARAAAATPPVLLPSHTNTLTRPLIAVHSSPPLRGITSTNKPYPLKPFTSAFCLAPTRKLLTPLAPLRTEPHPGCCD